MKLSRAKLLDAILLKFKDGRSIAWSFLRDGLFKDIHEDFFVIERHIKFLVSVKSLKEDANSFIISLDENGWAIMSDINNLGYVTTSIKERNSLIWKRSFQIVLGLSAIVGTLVLIYPCVVDDSSIDQSSKSHDQQQIITPPKTKPETLPADNHLLDTLPKAQEERIDMNIGE